MANPTISIRGIWIIAFLVLAGCGSSVRADEVFQSAREIPIVQSVDVVVVGGTVPGQTEDDDGLSEKILRQYERDIRGLFARHAKSVLSAK